MEEQTKVFEVQRIFTRQEEDKKIERIIIEKKNGVWVYHAPNAQDHTVEQLKEILNQLEELSK